MDARIFAQRSRAAKSSALSAPCSLCGTAIAKALKILLFNSVVTNAALARSAFDAIADPTRRAILDHLRDGELGAGEIAGRFPVSRPAIARHVRVLRCAGLVRERRQAQSIFYSLEPKGLAEVDRWLAPYRLYWAARLTDLKAFVEDADETSMPMRNSTMGTNDDGVQA